MGMHEEAPSAPDTFGLPEYRVTKWEIEIDGDDIRLVCGAKRFGHIEWFYTVVMKPEELSQCLQECASIADTIHALRTMGRRTSH
jgi:hypothetical protein